MLSSFVNRTPSIQFSSLERLLFLIVLTFGTAMVILIPPGAGYDEEDHLVRVWELSALSFVPGQLSPQELKYPIVFRDFAYRQQGSTGVIRAEFWQTYGRAPLDARGYVRREIDTKSVYSPALLLPQAAAMRLFGRSLDLPTLPVFYLCRLASLLSYLLLVWLAARLIPSGKWILLLLAAAPMALFQAATISPDAISNGLGFLFLAGCLRIHASQEIGWRQVAGLAVLIFLLFLAKLNLVPLVLLPFLLIRPARFSQKGSYAVLILVTLLLFAVEVAGWTLVAAPNSNSLMIEGADLKAQLLSILANPFRFAWIVMQDVFRNGWLYLRGWINGYGYYYWTPPAIVSLLFLLSLVAVLWRESDSTHIDRRARVVLLLVFIAGYIATVVPLYLSFTPVGADRIDGVQGRYFIPLVPLLFLALPRPTPAERRSFTASRWATGFLLATLFLNVAAIYLSFHVECGSTFYQTGLCYRPLSRDFTDPQPSPPITGETTLRQEIQVQCDGLTEIRLLLSPSAPVAQGMTRVTIYDPVDEQTLFDAAISNNDIATGDWHPLRFPTDWASAGKQYILTIRSEGRESGPGLTLLYSSQSDFDLGDLYENEQIIEEDLILQYGCATGLQKLWLGGGP